jgi:CheY-like chemotaxis protein
MIALVVEDMKPHADLARTWLSAQGFQVTVVRSVRESWRWVKQQLDPAQDPQQILILLDILLPDRHNQKLEGSVLATWLTEEMAHGCLRRAHIAGITSVVDEQREWEARAAGISLLIQKPINANKASILRDLMDLPYPTRLPSMTSHEERMILAFRKLQLQVMAYETQSRVAARVWTRSEIRLVIGALKPCFHLGLEEREEGDRLLAHLGGAAQAETMIWTQRHTLHAEAQDILMHLLSGTSQQTIARSHGFNRTQLDKKIDVILSCLAEQISTHPEADVG